jgi:hypothetical protein
MRPDFFQRLWPNPDQGPCQIQYLLDASGQPDLKTFKDEAK